MAHKIPPVSRETASLEAYKAPATGDKITSLPKTGQAALPVFENPHTVPSKESAFTKTASLKDDLTPLKERIKGLAQKMHLVAPSQLLHEINQCKKGLQGLQNDLEDLEFTTQFPLMQDLNPRQKESFAANVLGDAKKILAGG